MSSGNSGRVLVQRRLAVPCRVIRQMGEAQESRLFWGVFGVHGEVLFEAATLAEALHTMLRHVVHSRMSQAGRDGRSWHLAFGISLKVGTSWKSPRIGISWRVAASDASVSSLVPAHRRVEVEVHQQMCLTVMVEGHACALLAKRSIGSARKELEDCHGAP